MDPTVSHAGDSDHEFEHLDAPDPAELAQYQSGKLTMSDQESSPAHVPQDKGLGDYLDEFKHKGQEFVENLQEKGHELFENIQQKEEDFLADLTAPSTKEQVEDVPRQIVDDIFAEPPVQDSPVQDSPVHDSPVPEPPKDALDDILDNVKEVLPDPIRHSPLTDERKQIEEGIQSAVNDTHDEVDAILERLDSGSPAAPELNSPSGDSGRDTLAGLIGERHDPEPQIPVSDSLSGMREISPDEQTFDRRGPLTIPENVSFPTADSPVVEDLPSVPQAQNFEEDFEQVPPQHSHFDDLPARPPTPPKDLSDEDVQPPAIDLGPPSHAHEKPADQSLKPILRHHSGLGPWIDFKSVDPRVLDILYWRDPKKSGAALAVILFTLYLVSKFSLISLVAYGSLAVLIGTLGFRVFKLVEAQIKKTDGSNPFKEYLNKDLEVPQDRVHAQVDVFVEHGRNILNQLRRLFLVENVCDSVKFGLLLWTLTYIGAWFSGFALIILFVIGLFSVPKVYEIYKEPIDANLALARENVEKIHNIVSEKLPFLNKCCPSKASEKKEE